MNEENEEEMVVMVKIQEKEEKERSRSRRRRKIEEDHEDGCIRGEETREGTKSYAEALEPLR